MDFQNFLVLDKGYVGPKNEHEETSYPYLYFSPANQALPAKLLRLIHCRIHQHYMFRGIQH